ncbi:hypothetical protein THRCLA_20573 [Thraustotheca clavata]|uniref:Uncharacterized protein n=1 Tax=Thraustotheca clavata TaxID=74557 RepID=A0A1W0A6F8_9STRA|nr:hypothetical protein THRCLA_20573 [Thraustotheca clavata]
MNNQLLHARTLIEHRDVNGAIKVWRNLLKKAYDEQNHAAMFVLSKNLGDFVPDLLEAKDFYEYALEIATACGVMSDTALRGSIAAIAIAMQSIQIYLCPICRQPQRLQGNCLECEQNSVDVCATCANQFAVNQLVLDENDGLNYCQECYDAYYAQEDEEESSEDVGSENDVDEKITIVGCKACGEKATIRDWQGSNFCQKCFILHTQMKAAQEMNETNGRQNEESTINTSPERKTKDEIQNDEFSPPSMNIPVVEDDTRRLTYDRKFLLSLRNNNRACPEAIKSTPVHQPQSTKNKSTNKPKNLKVPEETQVTDEITMLCDALELNAQEFTDELQMYELYYHNKDK